MMWESMILCTKKNLLQVFRMFEKWYKVGLYLINYVEIAQRNFTLHCRDIFDVLNMLLVRYNQVFHILVLVHVMWLSEDGTLIVFCTVQFQLGTISHRVDKRIITKIHSLVHEGIRSVSEMRRHIEIFSKENFPTASRLSNQFYPTNKDIRNHMYSALCLER